MDKMDIKILSAMEEDSRISLKSLAKELDIKISTIYHRLHKMKEKNVIEKYTIVINPIEIGFTLNKIIQITLKNMKIEKLTSMFLESFSKYLSEVYSEIQFSSVGENNAIYVIGSYKNQDHFDAFMDQLELNPYIDTIHIISISKILKGKKLFSFNASQHTGVEKEGKMFNELIIDDLEKSDISEKSKTLTVQF